MNDIDQTYRLVCLMTLPEARKVAPMDGSYWSSYWSLRTEIGQAIVSNPSIKHVSESVSPHAGLKSVSSKVRGPEYSFWRIRGT